MSTASEAPFSLQMVGSKRLGGAEHWCLRFCAALAERRVPAELVIRSGSGVDAVALPPLPVHRLPFLTVWDPYSRSAVSRLIRSRRPDVVQTYMGRATRMVRLPRGGRPVHVARLGGYYALHPFRHAHAWVGNTRALCDWMVANGLPAKRVFHIYNFMGPRVSVAGQEIAALRARLGIPPDALVLVAAGRFVPFKAHRDLIEAFARLPAEVGGRPLYLVLLGEGPLESALRRQAAESGAGFRVVWPGWQSAPGRFFQMADLVVFPSRDEEPFGNVILDAWAWGKPLVVTSFRGAREVTRHGEDAWCVPCEDPPALAQGIELLLRDPVLAAKIARAGLARVQGDFSPDRIVGQYLDLYRFLLR